MSNDLLFEIGCEEIPARFINDLRSQLKNNLHKLLKSYRITFQNLNVYSTPRRLAVLVSSLADYGDINVKEERGPSMKVAKTKEGEWSPAAIGFAKKNNIALENLVVKSHKNIDYIFAELKEEGKSTKEVLPELLSKLLADFNFVYTMRWSKYKFIRPIRWLVALYGNETIPLISHGVTAGNQTAGHRFLGTTTEVTNPSDYEQSLEKQSVIVDHSKRKQMILQQLDTLKKENGWEIPIDESLLEEVVNLVEYPTALIGSFDDLFLELPRNVLITTMKEHQRYFYVEDNNGSLLPFFITVANNKPKDSTSIIKGNEKVLRARFEDAQFFYDEDLKVTMDCFVDKLNSVMLRKGLGSLGDKLHRLVQICKDIKPLLNLEEAEYKDLLCSGSIAKFALTTAIVNEFPELESSISEIYAIKNNKNVTVAMAVKDHYLPRSIEDALPETKLGTILSFVDKLDSLIGNYALGVSHTGSQDPYGLRRLASCILKLMLETKYLDKVNIPLIIDKVIKLYEIKKLSKLSSEELNILVTQSLENRLRNYMKDLGFKFDIIDSLVKIGSKHPKLILTKANYLSNYPKQKLTKEIENFSRVCNLATKYKVTEKYNLDLVVSVEEKELYESFVRSKNNYDKAFKIGDAGEMYMALADLSPKIEKFFENVMVMVADPTIKTNRLILMNELNNLICDYAQFNKL